MEVLLATATIQQNQYESFLNQFRLDAPEDIATYFAAQKNKTFDSIQARAHRLAHLALTGVWISERRICRWAACHPEQKISSLLKGIPVEKTVRRYENGMGVPRRSFVTKCVRTVKFFGLYVLHPKRIGALTPSSPALAKEIVSEIKKDPQLPGRRILEVGPGTGVFTDKIIKRMNANDTLDLVEFDENLARDLKRDYSEIRNVRVHYCSILDYRVPPEKKYDHIVSGLPLNSFPARMVEQIFTKFKELSREGTTLSYFEYPGLPELKRKMLLNAKAREDFRELLTQKAAFYKQYGFREGVVKQKPLDAKVLHHRIEA